MPKITVRVENYTHTVQVQPRIRNVVGSVRIVDKYDTVIGFYVRVMDLLILDPSIPKDVVKNIVYRVNKLRLKQNSILANVYRLLALAAAAVAAADGPAEVTPEHAKICGVTVTPENIVKVLTDDEVVKKLELCLSEHLAKLLQANSFRIAGVTVHL